MLLDVSILNTRAVQKLRVLAPYFFILLTKPFIFGIMIKIILFSIEIEHFRSSTSTNLITVER